MALCCQFPALLLALLSENKKVSEVLFGISHLVSSFKHYTVLIVQLTFHGRKFDCIYAKLLKEKNVLDIFDQNLKLIYRYSSQI